MRNNLLLIVLLFLFEIPATWAQSKWELKKSKDGIEIYSRNMLSGNIKELRVLCELDGTKEQLIATLFDISNYSKWVYGNKKSEIIKKVNSEMIIYFSEAHLCWPVKDRDLIIELSILHDSEGGNLNIQAKSIPNYSPLKANFIRIPYSLAKWTVSPVNNNKLKVDYTFSIDPGGSIPSWLVNATLAIGPYNSFMKLKELLKEKNMKVALSNKI